MSDYRFVAMGDSRGNDLSNFIDKPVLESANQSVAALNPAPSFVIFFGDNSIMGDNDFSGTNNFTYQDFYNFMRAPGTGLPAQLPFYQVVGNHELYQATLGDKFQSYTSQTGYQDFAKQTEALSPNTYNPNITSMPGHDNLDYSFASPDGQSLFVVMDGFYVPSSQNIPYFDSGNLNDDQLKYLNDTLSSSTAKTKFVISHNPAFDPTSQTYDTAVSPSMGQFWQIVDNNDVTAVLNGHVHMYSRTMVGPDFTSGGILDPNPGLHFTNTIPQIIAGSVGAPLIGTATNEPGNIYAPASWNWKDLYNYAVVDVHNSILGPSTVAVNSYASDGTGPWILCDSFTATNNNLASTPASTSVPTGDTLTFLPSSSTANALQLLQSSGG